MRTDTERLDWIMDVLSLGDDSQTDRKSTLLVGSLLLGRTGREAIDTAMDCDDLGRGKSI